MLSTIPAGLRVHLNYELDYIQKCQECPISGKSTRNFEPIVVTKTSKKGKVKTYLRKHYPILGMLNRPSSSCALGVPPVKLPKLSFPRGRNQHRKLMNVIDFACHVRNMSFTNNADVITEESLFTFKKVSQQNTVSPADQYDFFTSEIRIEHGELVAYGDIPHTNQRGVHPIRLPHLWMELFRRGFSFERPGPQGIGGPWILYNWEYLRSHFISVPIIFFWIICVHIYLIPHVKYSI